MRSIAACLSGFAPRLSLLHAVSHCPPPIDEVNTPKSIPSLRICSDNALRFSGAYFIISLSSIARKPQSYQNFTLSTSESPFV